MYNIVSREIMKEIEAAIQAEDRDTYVFYITGGGGTGKTVLLREVGKSLDSEDGDTASFPWSGILDLYHPDVNSNSGLEQRISKALERAHEFSRYREQRLDYTSQRQAGLSGSHLERERQKMAELFAQGVNRVTTSDRIVIALDTTERIEHEVDEIQRLCDLENETTTVKAWLLNQLRRWKNAVVLLVGRPEQTPYLGKALRETLDGQPGVHFISKTLGGFNEAEVEEYFTLKEKQYPEVVPHLDPKIRHRLWEVTEGKPIRLDLALEVIRHELGWNNLRDYILTADAKAILDEIDRRLIEHVMEGGADQALKRVLKYLAIARRGLDADLLHHLEPDWDLETAQIHLNAIMGRELIKRRPEDGRLYLHDEVALLCDKHLLDAEDVQRLSNEVMRWYDLRLAALRSREQDQVLHLDIDRSNQRKDTQIGSLLYRLRANPNEGYHWYVRQAEWAVRAVEVGFDMRLRNEILAFLHSQSPIDKRLIEDAGHLQEEFNRDEAGRWIKRYMARGDYKKALEIVRIINKSRRHLCPIEDPGRCRLAWSDLDVYHAQALIYTGNVDEAIKFLKAVIRDLEGDQSPELLARSKPDSYEGWRRNLILGRAHNNLGYAYWMHLGYLITAVSALQNALPYFRASNLREELANTSDNMGRVYALLRHPTRAKALVDTGLDLRRDLGRMYRLALSLNSRAIVDLEFSQPFPAHNLADRALTIFRQLNAQRGVGLASITLGRAFRQLGNLWAENTIDRAESEQYHRDSVMHLEQALRIFEVEVQEPVRWVEAANELGCLYRDQAKLARTSPDQAQTFRALTSRAIRYLEDSIERAREHELKQWVVENMEDLAQVYFLRQDYRNALYWLGKANAEIPEDYKIYRTVDQSPSQQDIASDQERARRPRVEIFWLLMGKIELLQGNIIFDQATRKDGAVSEDVLRKTAEHYLLSAAYFERFSQRAFGLQQTFRQMYDRFKTCQLQQQDFLREVIPELAKEYGIESARTGEFFQDTLGLAVNM